MVKNKIIPNIYTYIIVLLFLMTSLVFFIDFPFTVLTYLNSNDPLYGSIFRLIGFLILGGIVFSTILCVFYVDEKDIDG